MNYLIFGGSCDLGKNFILEVVNNETNPFFFVSSSNEKNKKKLEIFLKENNINFLSFDCDFNNLKLNEIEFLKEKSIDHIYFFSAFTEIENGKVSNEYLQKSLNINGFSIIKIINNLIEKIENKVLTLNFISSVAAAVPKKKNYIYASSKIMIEHYLKSLKYYFGLKKPYIKIYRLGILSNKKFKNKFIASNIGNVSKAIFKNQKLENNGIYYVPRIWRLIIIIILFLPNFIFKKINF